MKHALFLLFLVIDSSLTAIGFTHRNDPYATHQPVLYEMAMRTTGPIIEFGCGNGSTDLLHEICRKTQRTLITVEDNWDWMVQFINKYRGDGYLDDNSGWHKFFYIPGKYDHADPQHWVDFLDNSELLRSMDFDVCFVDQDPWLARYETIKRFKSKAKYIILHDCDYYPLFGIFGTTLGPQQFDFGDLFRTFKVYYPIRPWPGHTGPPTLLGSDFEDDLPEINYANY